MKRVLLVLFVLALAAWATPNLVSYQGKLDKDGEPFSGEASMNFALYESKDATTSFWEETQTVIVVDGIFNVLLGSVNELPALPTDGCWLEVTIDSDVLPRQQITSVPYAEVAQQVCANYKMVEDTAMDYTCPADGVLLIGGGGLGEKNWTIKVDGKAVLSADGMSVLPVSITAGEHHISLTYFGADTYHPYLWAIFMR
ncbi:MAG: hypothetical protein E3J71_01895 [Candidatus Stahlbacteria bacterium]|nr:MAG: hypothetical protein E3J71_01895 [Candidatus Stahlbacteria bacterium]